LAAEVTDAAGGNVLTFMTSELNRAAEQKADEDRELRWKRGENCQLNGVERLTAQTC
jgi:hypothetical protein